MNIVKSAEASKTQMRAMGQASTQDDVHKVKFTNEQNRYPQLENKKHSSGRNKNSNNKPCDRCGGKHRHDKPNCFAFGRVCGACSMKNHFTKQCKTNVKHIKLLKN